MDNSNPYNGQNRGDDINRQPSSGVPESQSNAGVGGFQVNIDRVSPSQGVGQNPRSAPADDGAVFFSNRARNGQSSGTDPQLHRSTYGQQQRSTYEQQQRSANGQQQQRSAYGQQQRSAYEQQQRSAYGQQQRSAYGQQQRGQSSAGAQGQRRVEDRYIARQYVDGTHQRIAANTDRSAINSATPNIQGTHRRQPVQQQYGTRTPNQAGRPVNAKGKRPTGAAQNARKKKKKKHSVLSGTLKVLISVLLCTAILSVTAIVCINDVLAINKSTEPITVEIPESASTDEVIDIFADNGLIKLPYMSKLMYKVISKIKNSSEPTYVSGVFYLKASMGLEGMINKLKETPNYSQTISLSFPEGWSINQIFTKLDEYGVCDKDYLFKAVDTVNFNYDFLDSAKDNKTDSRYLTLEGYFFPDTYEFFLDYNANSVIEIFLSNFENKWTAEYSQRAEELGFTADDIIRIASIIQREAANTKQMADISSVIHNRLDNYVTYPTLDCDSTYNYITKYVKPVVGDLLAERYMRAYNTYVCQKLPAGAICNPGNDAIYAALYPNDTDYYYFQHDSAGKIYLAKTNAEHNRYKSEIAYNDAQ